MNDRPCWYCIACGRLVTPVTTGAQDLLKEHRKSCLPTAEFRVGPPKPEQRGVIP